MSGLEEELEFCSRCGAPATEGQVGDHMDIESCLRAAVGRAQYAQSRFEEIDATLEALKLTVAGLTPRPAPPEPPRKPMFYNQSNDE